LLDRLRTKRDSALARLCTGRRRLRLHPRLDLTRHGQKRLLHIGRRLGRRFQKLDPKRVGKLFALFRRYNTLGREIALVADQELVNVFRRISVNFVQPLLNIVEGFGVGHVVNDNNAVRAAVVGRRNRTKAFLAGCVPNLQLDRLLVQLNGADFL
jgi:hypothetical protein